MKNYIIKEIPRQWGTLDILRTPYSFVDALVDPSFHEDCPICSIETKECNRCGYEVPVDLIKQHNEKCSDDEVRGEV